MRIIEAISRFRAGGYDERLGFTVYDTLRYKQALEPLVAEEVEVLTERLAGDVDPDRAVEMIEAGVGPLNDLIAALHTKLLVAELERHRGGELTIGSPGGLARSKGAATACSRLGPPSSVAAVSSVGRRTAARISPASFAPSGGIGGRGDDPHHHLVAVELLERDVRRVAGGDGDRALEQLLDLARSGVGAEAGPQLDPLRLAQRHHGQVEDHRVRDHDPVGAADQGGVEEAERADDSLQLPASAPPTSRTRSPTRNGRVLSSTRPANRLPSVCCAARPSTTAVTAPPTASVPVRRPAILQRQRDDDGRSSSAGSGTRPCPRSPDPCGETAPGRSPRPSAWASAHPRIARATTVATFTGVPRPGNERPAMVEEHQDRGDQAQQDEDPAAGPLGALAIDLGPEADLAPLLGARLERVARAGEIVPVRAWANVCPRSAGRHGSLRRQASDLARTYTA